LYIPCKSWFEFQFIGRVCTIFMQVYDDLCVQSGERFISKRLQFNTAKFNNCITVNKYQFGVRRLILYRVYIYICIHSVDNNVWDLMDGGGIIFCRHHSLTHTLHALSLSLKLPSLLLSRTTVSLHIPADYCTILLVRLNRRSAAVAFLIFTTNIIVTYISFCANAAIV